MDKQIFLQFLSKFITVTTNDGREYSGYISNGAEFQSGEDVQMLVLLNGLMSQNIPLSRIVNIRESNRNDSVDVHPLGDQNGELSEAQLNKKIDEIYEDILHDDDMNLDLNSLLDYQEK